MSHIIYLIEDPRNAGPYLRLLQVFGGVLLTEHAEEAALLPVGDYVDQPLLQGAAVRVPHA